MARQGTANRNLASHSVASNGTAPTRDLALDALKGTAILAVVFGHILDAAHVPESQMVFRTLAIYTLYLFNVQLFAFVSGYLMHRIDLKKKARGLLLPLAAWLLLYTLAGGVHRFSDRLISYWLPGVFSGSVSLWFLWALFVSFCIAFLLRRWPWVLIGVAVAFGAIWEVLPASTGVRTVGLILPFMVLGALWKRFFADRQPTVLWSIAALIAMPLAVFATLFVQRVWLPGASSQTTWYLMGILALVLKMVAGSLACIGLLGVCRAAAGLPLKPLAALGAISLGIYGFHALMLTSTSPVYVGSATSILDAVMKLALITSACAATAYVLGLFPVFSTTFLGGRMPLPKPAELARRIVQLGPSETPAR